MPNWCYNYAIVEGDPLELKRFVEVAKRTDVIKGNETGLLWNFVSPSTEALPLYLLSKSNAMTSSSDSSIEKSVVQDLFLETHQADWYNWNINNWGTKWDTIPDWNTIEDTTVTFQFETAWAPPQPVFEAMAKQFPSLNFTFEVTEEADQYAGVVTYEQGVQKRDEWYSNPTHKEYDKLGLLCTSCMGNTDRDFEDGVEYFFRDCPVDEDKYEWLDNHGWKERDK